MKLTREELAKALVKGLKLDDNIFNYQAVAEEIETIQEKDFMDFYKVVMTENTYGNGLQAIMRVSEQFKPKSNTIEARAKKIILFVETQNTMLGELAKARGEDFIKLVNGLKPVEKYKRTFAVMDNVAPYFDAKQLIMNIRHYQTTIEQINAFIKAIERYESISDDENMIAHTNVKKLLRGVKC